MKLPVIKAITETYNVQELKAAENALYNEEKPAIEIIGDDEGEQLTHVLASIFILELMAAEGIPYKDALRAYTSKVRSSIN